MPPKKTQTTSAAQQNTTQQNQAQQPATQDAVSLLKADHRKVEGLFAQYEKAGSAEEKSKLAKQICKELIVHTKLEEEIFYQACREKNVEDDMLDEAQVEHDGAKVMIAELIAEEPSDEYYDAKVTVLSEYIKHHVGEEEKPRDGIFAKAQKAGVDMNALGQKLQARKQELTGQIDENNLQPPKPRSLDPQNLQGQESTGMARYSNDRDRDERGRFTSDDNDRRGGYSSSSRGGYSSRSRDDDDDRRGGYRGGSDGRERDDQGRFMSDDDGQRGGYSSSSRGGYSSRSRDDDDDDRRGGNRYGGRSGEGRGWYGDSEGHSEAAERGWEGRSSSRSGGDYSSRSRDDDDRDYGRSGSRSDGGRSGEGRGWYGDSEGHSEAAERGWEGRSSSRGSSSSRSRDDDDDRGGRGSSSRGGSSRGGRDEGHGGWFGDSRGHAEAARRGWQHRD